MRTPPTLLRTCVFLLPVAFIAGCGSSSNSRNALSNSSSAVSNGSNAFSIQPAASSVAVGGTVALQAILVANGAPQNVTSQTTWTVSDPSVATVQNSVLQSKAVGTVTVNGSFTSSTAANGTATASASLTITPAAPVVTWPQPAVVPAGTALSSTQLNATANVPGTFAYNPAAGTVLQPGTQALTANFTPSDSKTYSSAAASTTINVAGAISQSPTLTVPVILWPQPTGVTAGTALSAAQLDATANVPGTFTYNPTAGTVLKTGTQTLTANFTPSDSKTYSFAAASTAITVTDSTSQSPTLTVPLILWPQPAGIPTGTALSSTQLNATANVPGTFTYNPAAGTVLQPGTQTLTANFTPNDSKTYSSGAASTTIIVTTPVSQSPTLTAVRISGSSATVQTGQSIQFAAAAVYSDNSSKDVTSAATWNSSNTPVASVRSGTVSGVAAGTTQISASYNSVPSAPATVTVNAPSAKLTAIQISGSSTVGAGASTQMKATGTYSDQTTKDISSAVTWASSQYSVATVQGGSVTGVNSGTASITASLSGVTGTAAITVTSGYVVQIDPSMNQKEIQSKITGSQTGDTIAFAAGTYNLTSPALSLPAGRTYFGSTSGATVLSGTGGYALMIFYGNGLTLQNFVFNGGGLYLGGAVTNVHLEYNTFENINAPYSNWTSEIAIIIDTSAANSDISYNKFNNIGANLLDQFVDEVFSSGIFGYGLSNTTIQYNTFDTFNEGIHIFYDSLDGKNVHINNNTFVRGHRIAIEQQDGNAGGLEVAYNKLSEPLNAWALTYGLSIAATSNSGTGIIVHDNLINADTPVGVDCRGSGCYYPYGIEAWGTGTHVYSNTIEGLWGHGVAIGAASNLSVTSNYICGPNMAQNNTFVDFEYGSEPGTVIQSNTTSANMSCGTGN